jgi:uncharacterized protein (DUF1330 family)
VGILRDVKLGPPIVEYLERIDATLAAFEGHFIVHGGTPEMLEGTSPGTLIVIEFPDRAHAEEWYASPQIRNIERDSRYAFGVAIHGYDVALEGRAARVTDDAQLQRLAQVFAEGGWAPTVADGGFTHEYSAPSAGPPPWFVYEFTPEDAYAVMGKDPGRATRWTF